MRAARLFALLLVAAAPVRAHEWYDGPCCSDHDCFPERDGKQVTGEPVPGGYVIRWAGREWVFDERQVLRSHDGHYHICLPFDDESGYAARPRCVYVPMSAT